MSQRVSALYRQNIGQLGDADVIVASYGGAGQALIGNILLELGLNYVDPYTEVLLPDGSSLPGHGADREDFRRRLAATNARDASSQGRSIRRPWPRFVKTHLPPEEFAGRDLGGVWILIRDPRDALYSWYQWRRQFGEEVWDQVQGTFEEFLRRPDYSGLYPVDEWCAFYQAWSRRAEGARQRTSTRFEDLKQRTAEAVRQALQAFEVEVADRALQRAVARSSFESMRAHEDAVAASGGDATPSRIMRSGKVQGWREWMTPELEPCFAGAALAAIAERFDYTAPAAAPR